MDRNVKYLIIGAGISGLTFANYAKGDYLIIEKEDEVGGYCRTIAFADASRRNPAAGGVFGRGVARRDGAREHLLGGRSDRRNVQLCARNAAERDLRRTCGG